MAQTEITPLSSALWQRLDQLLQQTAAAEIPVSFWWRDDDAVADTPALQQLLELSAKSRCPVALAVIPATLEATLAPALQRHSAESRCLLHGFDHQNYSPAGVRKCELGPERDLDAICHALQRGDHQLSRAFAGRYLPVLVPPWNRLRADLPERLAKLGLCGLSALGEEALIPGLRCHNVHLDLIDWKARAFAGEAPLLAKMCGLIEQRLQAAARGHAVQPIGLMSHHLVTDQPTWAFLERLLMFLSQHAGTRFSHPEALFS